MLLYDKRRWTTVGHTTAGCLSRGSQRRHPYVVQGFVDDTGFNMLVVAAHFPPPTYFWLNRPELASAVEGLKRNLGIVDVLLIAEVELNTEISSFQILDAIAAAPRRGEGIQTTDSIGTCCYAKFKQKGSDRVAANFGNTMSTIVPFPKSEILKWGAPNMHLAIIGSLEYGTAMPQWLESGSQPSSKQCCTILLILIFVPSIILHVFIQ